MVNAWVGRLRFGADQAMLDFAWISFSQLRTLSRRWTV